TLQTDGSTRMASESDKLMAAVPLKDGDVLTSQKLHAAIQALYATGKFSNIEVLASRLSQEQLALTFLTQANFFVGSISVTGEPKPPTANQLANATKLGLGELFDPAALPLSIERMKNVLEDNGYYGATVTGDYEENPDTQQVNLFFNVVAGNQALVGKVTVKGDPGMG